MTGTHKIAATEAVRCLICLDADMATRAADGGLNALKAGADVSNGRTLRACTHEVILHDERLLPADASLPLSRHKRPLLVVVTTLGLL